MSFKKLSAITFTTLAPLMFAGTVFAATPKPVSDAMIQEINQEISDEQIVQILPDGGFIYNADGSSDFSPEIVKQNNGALMPYKVYKEMDELEYTTNPQLPTIFRSANPNDSSLKVLEAGQTYNSARFSGSGWRFSGYRFQPQSGTGTWLLWQSRGDSGLVGTINQARSTKNGSRAYLSAIQNHETKYVNGGSNWVLFYTYNPVPGSTYSVSNR